MIRDIENKLKELIEDPSLKDSIIVEGARQVGKSYLINSILSTVKSNVLSFDLEKESKLRQKISATQDFEDFKTLLRDQYGAKDGSIIFFDEAQESRTLARYVKSFKEEWPQVRVILSGSSMNRFFDASTRIPVGRYRTFFVQGFSFLEFLRFNGGEELADFVKSAPHKIPASRHTLLLEYYDHYLKVGGYPEAVKAFYAKGDYHSVIREISASMAEDFSRKEEYEPTLFEKVLMGVSNNLGMPSKLSHIDEKKYITNKVLHAMMQWHIVHEVQAHAADPHHSGFLPKRYLHDVGLAHLMRSVAAPTMSIIETFDPVLRIPLGGLIENAVLISLLEGLSASEKIDTWKKQNANDIEVDFVIKTVSDNVPIPIECKAATRFKNGFAKNVIHFLDIFGGRCGVVVSAAPFAIIKIDEKRTILNIPVYLLSRNNLESYYLNT